MGPFLKSNLLHILDTKGLSADDLSKEIGLSEKTLSAWLSGKGKVQAAELMKLANFAGETIERICFSDLKKLPQSQNLFIASTPRQVYPTEILERTHTPFGIIDTSIFMVYANAALCSFLGYRREDLVARHGSEVTHVDDRLRTANLVEKFSTSRGGVITSQDFRLLCADGLFKWVRANAVVMAEDKMFFIFYEDVTTLYPPEPPEEAMSKISSLFESAFILANQMSHAEGKTLNLRKSDSKKIFEQESILTKSKALSLP